MSFLFLIFLHHVGDVWAQPTWLITLKKKHLFSIYEHCVIWSGIISFGLIVLGLFSPWKFFFLLIGHFIIDWYKYQKTNGKYEWIYLDQFLHYTQIVTVFLT
jgi:hypothetical protein